MNIHKNNKGFTLFEVILALSIISVSLLGLLRAYVMIDHSRVHSAQYTQALYLQGLKLQDILEDKSQSQLTREGIFEPPFEQFHWEISQTGQAQSGFKDVHLKIFWTVFDQTKDISLSTYIRKKNGEEITE